MNIIALTRMRIASIVLLLIISLSALAASYGFIADPTGRGLGMTTDYIRHSPFSSFLIPGIVLFIANGLLSLTAAIAAIRRGRHYQDLIYLQGLILGGWIIIQVVMVRDFNWMHAACLAISWALTRLGRKLKTGGSKYSS